MADEHDAGDPAQGAPKDEDRAEAFAAEEQVAFDEEGATDPVMVEVHETRIRTKASWSLVPSQVFTLLFANVLFFTGALADWTRVVPGDAWDPSRVTNGLDWIRGSVIFALALYGFFTSFFNIWHFQMKVWPFLLNALLALWVGVGTIASKIGSAEWDHAIDNLHAKASHTFLEKATYPLGVIPPGPWLLTLGGVIVLIVLIKGVMSGAAAAKASGRRR